MSMTETRARIREAARAMNIQSGQVSMAQRVKKLTADVLNNWGAVAAPSGSGAFGLETYGSGAIPIRNGNFDAVRDGDVAVLMQGLKKIDMSNRHIEEVAECCLTLFDPEYNASAILTATPENPAYASISQVVGRSAATSMSLSESGPGVEAFGADMDRLNTDDRLTMSLMIMRPYENIMDKAIARVPQASPVVTIRVPQPQAWDWAASQNSNATAAQRNSNNYRLRDLYRNPTPVNSAAKKITPLAANDSGSVLWNSTTNYATAKDVNVLDLSKNSAVFTYAKIDRTDIVADGGVVDSVIITITDPNGGSSKTESFSVNTRALALSHFVMNPNNRNSGERQVIMDVVMPIGAGTPQFDGSASTIAAKFTGSKISAKIRFSATLNLQTGDMQGSGTITMTNVGNNGGSIPAGEATTFGTLQASVSAYSVDIQFDEQNQRKANLAVWVQYSEQQFVVPQSRIYFTEYSLSQDLDDNAVAATSSIMALGNGRRGLGVIVDRLNDVAETLTFAASNPEVALSNVLDDKSFASSLVKPMVLSTELNFGTEELNTMNESTRLTEIHGRFRARFLSMLATLFAKSLMLNQYKGGETPVIKAWVHVQIADVVIGILDYHNELNDKAKVASGADYSMFLPNGYRLDVVKSNLDCLQNRLYAVPVIESDMASVLSAASIRDCGMVTTNYTPTNAGAVVRRVATTNREVVMMSNPVGIMMNIYGLDTQLGGSSYAKLAMNADYSDSLAA